jgi:hypothetical protein
MLTQTLSATLELPVLPAISELEFRALRHDDVPALYELLLAVERADDRDLVQTLKICSVSSTIHGALQRPTRWRRLRLMDDWRVIRARFRILSRRTRCGVS